jgi:Protein of unknown function (DUF3039)
VSTTFENDTDTLTREDTDLRFADPGDKDRFSHYTTKKQIERSIFDGIPWMALCGFKSSGAMRDPKRFPTCPTCKDILDAIHPEVTS